MFTASVATFMKKNAKSSRNDLADLSKSCPRQKYRIYYRRRVNFRVTFDLFLIIGFSRFDLPKHALIQWFWCFGGFGEITHLVGFWSEITTF